MKTPNDLSQHLVVREELAGLCHEMWAGWMAYFFEKCKPGPDGSITVPADYFIALQRQISTAYCDLSEEEQESDRAEADRILEVLGW